MKASRFLSYVLAAIIVLVLTTIAMTKMSGSHERAQATSLTKATAFEEALKAAQGQK